jgi:photosystem II stability/assembly factor-like uncharacterized protein
MTRRTAIQSLAGGAVAAAAETKAIGPRWALQYFYDREQETFHINDFRMTSPTHGMAVGWISDKKGKAKPMSVVTRDGGSKWEQQPLPDDGISLFFLNDSLGWLVGDKALWRTEEGGRDWKKLKGLKDVNRVYFLDEEHGWAVCDKKTVLETKDGGKNWTEVAAAKEPSANPDYTSYTWIDFLDPKQGIIIGASTPPRPGSDKPAWMEPEAAAKRREWPSLTITLETRDSGATWKPQTAPAFGQTTRFRATADGRALVLIRFNNAFDWPSEVYLVKQRGASSRVFREKDRVVTDLAWLSPSKAVMVAIEPPGKLPQLPVPGKLHILTSDDLTTWSEAKVDYRAFGTNALLSAVGEDLAWVATDTGQILHLVK